MAPKGISVIQVTLKRLAEEEVEQKQHEARVSVDAAGRPKGRAAAA